jgi:MarR family transcriptional regulator for hemolysin
MGRTNEPYKRNEPKQPEAIWWGSPPWRLHQVVKAGLDHFERRFRAEGGTRATWSVLELLVLNGPLAQRDLAELLGIEGPTLTRQVDRLVAADLLERRTDPEDRRMTRVELTPAGRDLYQRLAVVARETKEEVLRGFTPQDMDQLAHLLDLLEANLH